MARHLQSLFEVDAVLTAVVPLHVGNSDTEMAQDAPLACNGAGNPYLPGTSLAGPLRAWWREAFGNVAGWGDESDEYGYASLISVEDAPAILDGGVPELRDGVGIDRFTGAAAKNIKYDRQILPAGTTFGFKLRLEVPAKADKDEPVPFLQPDQWLKRLSGMMRALEAGHIRFGAGKTRGFGRVEASDIVIIRHELNTADGILARLTGDSPKLDWTKVAPEQLPNRVVLLVNWRATSPVMNNSGLNGLAIDAFPLTTGSRAERLAVLTGASIKGVLRSQAERIWRTLDGRSGADQTPNHLKQIELELVEPLFGGPGKAEKPDEAKEDKTDKKKKSASRTGLGALGVDDCLFGPSLTKEQWRAMLDAGGAQETAVADAQTNIDGNAWGKAGARISQHVAIDRWTGGAADGFLFNRLQPPKSTGTFRLALDLARLVDCDGKDVSGACIALLLFVLRDLAQGRIAVGFGGNRGLGSIEIVDFKIESAGKAAAMRGFSAAEFKPEALTNPDSAFLQGFGAANAAWKSYWQGRKQEGEGKGGGNV